MEERGRGVQRVRAIRAPGLLGLSLLGVFSALLGGCQGALDPKGPQAERIADLSWVLFSVAFVIFVLVIAVLAIALFRRPGPNDSESRDRLVLIGGGGLVLPAIVLFSVIGLTVDALRDLTRPASAGALQIEITGHDFWWDVVYPASGVRTANEIHIPADETVSITGTSVDVIHSFWAPEINGKMDLIPGKVNEFKLHADEPGTYRGQCAEFCGLGHAKMAFFLIVQPRDEFDAWLASQQGAAAGLTDNRTQAGRQVFFDNSCASCHGLTNDEAPPVAAPNLSHLATRTTIAGGTLSLTEQSLERWIRDPSSIKPGVNMPSYQELSSEDMEALVQFLLSLQ